MTNWLICVDCCLTDGTDMLYSKFNVDSSSPPDNAPQRPNSDYNCVVATTGQWRVSRCDEQHRVVCQSGIVTFCQLLFHNYYTLSSRNFRNRKQEYCSMSFNFLSFRWGMSMNLSPEFSLDWTGLGDNLFTHLLAVRIFTEFSFVSSVPLFVLNALFSRAVMGSALYVVTIWSIISYFFTFHWNKILGLRHASQSVAAGRSRHCCLLC